MRFNKDNKEKKKRKERHILPSVRLLIFSIPYELQIGIEITYEKLRG